MENTGELKRHDPIHKRPPVEWKIKSVTNEEQTVTIQFPTQHEEQAVMSNNDSPAVE